MAIALAGIASVTVIIVAMVMSAAYIVVHGKKDKKREERLAEREKNEV